MLGVLVTPYVANLLHSQQCKVSFIIFIISFQFVVCIMSYIHWSVSKNLREESNLSCVVYFLYLHSID